MVKLTILVTLFALFAPGGHASDKCKKVVNSPLVSFKRVSHDQLPDRLSARPQAATVRMSVPWAPLNLKIGRAEVEEKKKEFVERATSISSSKQISLQQALLDVFGTVGSENFTAYIDPDGSVRPTDGHHALFAVVELADQFGIPMHAIPWTFSLSSKNDFRARSWHEFVDQLVSEGQFPEGAPTVNDLRNLTRQNIGNSPMRSAMGRFFMLVGIKGSTCVNKAQFMAGNLFESLGVTVSPGAEYDLETQGQLLELLFSSSHSESLQNGLLDLALPDHRPSVREAIKASLTTYSMIRSQFPQASEGIPADAPAHIDAARLFTAMKIEASEPVPAKYYAIPTTRDTLEKLKVGAQKAAVERMDTRRLGSLLKDLKVNGPKNLSRSDLKILKEARRALLMWRGTLRLVAEGGRAPKTLDEFTRNLGQLNDNIKLWSKSKGADKKKHYKKITKTQAKSLLAALHDLEGSLEINETISVSQLGAFYTKIQSQIREIRSLTEKAGHDIQSSRLTVEEYHYLRRRIREFMALYQVWQYVDPTISHIAVASMLQHLSHHMGEIKDGWVLAADSNAKKLMKQRTGIDPPTTRLILDFVARIEEKLHEVFTNRD